MICSEAEPLQDDNALDPEHHKEDDTSEDRPPQHDDMPEDEDDMPEDEPSQDDDMSEDEPPQEETSQDEPPQEDETSEDEPSKKEDTPEDQPLQEDETSKDEHPQDDDALEPEPHKEDDTEEDRPPQKEDTPEEQPQQEETSEDEPPQEDETSKDEPPKDGETSEDEPPKKEDTPEDQPPKKDATSEDQPPQEEPQTCSEGKPGKISLAFLEMHNAFRSAEEDSYRSYLARDSSASKMRRLEYDCEAEESATKVADQCLDTASSPEKYDQNLEFIQADDDTTDYILEAANSWWSEILDTHDNLYNSTVNANFANVCDFFLFRRYAESTENFFEKKMLWETREKIGCALKKCSGKTVVVCHYPKVLVLTYSDVELQSELKLHYRAKQEGDPIYTIGDGPCKECSADASHCVDNLCSKSKEL
ncbi:SCP-like protein [Ancylostoma ceylanicum]|uniref:SCP-like protein n=1 Tax=Ancylostoma ceylanicum TaxID=53326 RepID=A0A0D6M000_9BILA|nr:SCP-like protein [Ancylostoma ceylanicum]